MCLLQGIGGHHKVGGYSRIGGVLGARESADDRGQGKRVAVQGAGRSQE